jgi:hypothetical protein
MPAPVSCEDSGPAKTAKTKDHHMGNRACLMKGSCWVSIASLFLSCVTVAEYHDFRTSWSSYSQGRRIFSCPHVGSDLLAHTHS